MLLHLLQVHAPLLVLAPLVLEPDLQEGEPLHVHDVMQHWWKLGGDATHSDDARTEVCHLDELLLHERVRSRVGGVAGAQCVQLLLVEHRAHARRLVRLVLPTSARR